LSEIRAHRVVPGVFGRYYDLVFACAAERHDDAQKLLHEIVQLSRERPQFAILPYTEDALGADTERYARLLSLEVESLVALTAPKDDEWNRFKESATAALGLIEAADEALASEIRELVIELVGARRSAQAGRGFGGASSFMLWGSVLLNTEYYDAKLDMMAALIHEAAHQLLFGLSLDQPVVENDVEERYASPLRPDPRPMDGIFHATFVCARMHYGYMRLIKSQRNELSPADQALIEQRLQKYSSKFFDGLATIQHHGRITANRNGILTAATDYMRSAKRSAESLLGGTWPAQ
jgi:HEXXH motif-containing protein